MTKKLLKRYKSLVILAVLIIVGLCTVGAVAAGWWYRAALFPTQEVMVETDPAMEQAPLYRQHQLSLLLRIWLVGSGSPTEAAELRLSLAEELIETRTIEVTTEPQELSFDFNLTDLAEGEHQLQGQLVNHKGETLWQAMTTVIKDVTAPTASSTASVSGTARISVATESGLVSITDTKAAETTVMLTFSEPGILSLEPVTDASFSSTVDQTATPSITIPAAQKPFKTPYTFTDVVGQVYSGQLNYYYDAKPPTFTLTSETSKTDKWGKGYMLMFTPSESVSQVSVTLRGQALSVSKAAQKAEYFAKATLEEGDNIFTISAVDTVGNRGAQNVTVKMTHDPTPIFPTKASSFRPCTMDMRNQCREKSGYGYDSRDCNKFKDYVYCLRPLCDSTTASNICGDSRDL